MDELLLGGRYRLDELLGTGGMSVVWRADDEVLGRVVAVKVLSGPRADGPAARRRIREEARAAAALSHPHLAQVFDFGESDDAAHTPYVVMELLTGETLERRMAGEPIAPREAFRICAEVAAGLAAAHAAGLVHRDVKPANIMLTPHGAKLLDFGIAAIAGPERLTDGDGGGEIFGTPAYLAPERLTSDAVTPASDVYALGVLLYRLLAGRLPWRAAGPTQLIVDHVGTRPDPLPDLPGVPRAVSRLCMSCLAKDPEARPIAQRLAVTLADAADRDPEDDEAAGASSGRRLALAALITVPGVALAWLLTDPSRVAGPGNHAQAVTERPATPARTPGTQSPVPASRSSSGPASGADGGGPAGAETGTGQPIVDGQPSSAAPSAHPSGVASSRPPATLTSDGGTVSASCTDAGLARLLSWSPARSYLVDEVESGPARTAVIAFRHGNTVVRMTVTCTGGIPSADVTKSGLSRAPAQAGMR